MGMGGVDRAIPAARDGSEGMSAWGSESWWPLPALVLRGVFIPHGWCKYVAGWCRCHVCCAAKDERIGAFLASRRAA